MSKEPPPMKLQLRLSSMRVSTARFINLDDKKLISASNLTASKYNLLEVILCKEIP